MQQYRGPQKRSGPNSAYARYHYRHPERSRGIPLQNLEGNFIGIARLLLRNATWSGRRMTTASSLLPFKPCVQAILKIFINFSASPVSRPMINTPKKLLNAGIG